MWSSQPNPGSAKYIGNKMIPTATKLAGSTDSEVLTWMRSAKKVL